MTHEDAYYLYCEHGLDGVRGLFKEEVNFSKLKL